MSNKTNDEKLRILQERLSQIKEKNETISSKREQKEKVINSETPEVKVPNKKKNSFYSSRYIYVIIIGAVTYAVFFYNNSDSTSFPPKVSSSKEVKEEIPDTKLKYKLDLKGEKIAIINSFEDEISAKKMANELSVKGFKCDYFFLPEKSNSTEEVYKVFIGPYESSEEVNQWKQNINGEVEILNL